MKDVWAFGLMFPAFHPFLVLAIPWVKAFTFLSSPYSFFSCVCGPLGCGSCHTTSLCLYSITSLFISCYPVGLRADAPAVLAHFFINLLLRASLAHFSHLYLFWALLASIPTVPAYFIPRVFSAHLLLFYLFYSHGLFAKSFGLPRSNTTSLPLIYFSVLLAFKLTQ